jgi:hypothetical protein
LQPEGFDFSSVSLENGARFYEQYHPRVRANTTANNTNINNGTKTANNTIKANEIKTLTTNSTSNMTKNSTEAIP